MDQNLIKCSKKILIWIKSKVLIILTVLLLLGLAIIPYLSHLFMPEETNTSTHDIPQKCLKQYRSGGVIPGAQDCVRRAVTTHGGMGGYHCTGSKGYEWSQAYCSVQLPTPEQQENGISGINYDGIPQFDPEHRDYHDYTVVNTCLKSQPGCTRQQIFEKLKRFPAPFASGEPIADEQTSYAWPVGYVRHEIDDGQYTITNITLNRHLLAVGIVERRVIEDGLTVSVETQGRGTGAFRVPNIVMSQPLWSWVDANIFK